MSALWERAPVGVAALDGEGRFLAANAALLGLLGRGEDELLGRTLREVTHPEDAPSCAELLAKLSRREIESFQMEKRFLRKDGVSVWSLAFVTGYGPDGEGRRAIGMAIDITARKDLEAELEKRVAERTAALAWREALLSAQLETSIDGILVVDPKGRILSRNRRFAEMWGLAEETLATGSDDEALAAVLSKLSDPGSFLARVKWLYDRPDERSFDQLPLRDGRVLERFSGPVRAADGAPLGRVWYFRDVTARVHAERELARSNAELEMFAYAASHDLTAPLRKISAFAGLLAGSAGTRLDERERDWLARLRRAAAGASKLVDDALTLSRVDHERLEIGEVDLNETLAFVIESLAPEIEASGARFEAARLPVLRVHEPLMRRCLRNLVDNAIKFRKPGTAPTVRVECETTERGFELTVSDDGVGFAQEDAEKAFAPFVRLSPTAERDGSGIGLAICRRVAERYGGTMTAQASPGRGARFTLRLPSVVLSRAA